jgi:hypothetical protein
MSRPRTSQHRYIASANSDTSAGTKLVVLNGGAGDPYLCSFSVFGSGPGGGTLSTVLYHSRNGTMTGDFTSICDIPTTEGNFNAQSSCGTGWSVDPNIRDIFLWFSVNYRKGFFWEARKGKEFRLLGPNHSFDLYIDTSYADSLLPLTTTMVFEE